MALRDYRDFDAGLLRLPIGGREYIIPEVTLSTGVLLRRAIEGDADAVAELDAGTTLYERVLGDAYALMKANDVPEGALERAVVTALADFRHGRVAAEMAWETGQDPEALAAALAATQRILSTP